MEATLILPPFLVIAHERGPRPGHHLLRPWEVIESHAGVVIAHGAWATLWPSSPAATGSD
jgi:hypothetical protein